MNLKLLTLIASSLIIASCSHQVDSKDNKQAELDYPYTIEWGPYGKGSSLHPSTIKINKDSVRIIMRDQENPMHTRSFAIASDQTKFESLLRELEPWDGDKHYNNPDVRDGGYWSISNKNGSIKFVNVFMGLSSREDIRPDTIGLDAFENLFDHARSVLKENK